MPFFGGSHRKAAAAPEPEPVYDSHAHSGRHSGGRLGGMFGSQHSHPEPAPVQPEPVQNRKTGLLRRSRDDDGYRHDGDGYDHGRSAHHSHHASTGSTHKKHGLFGRRNSSPSPVRGRGSFSSSGSSSHGVGGRRSSRRSGGGLLGGGRNKRDLDPSILAARERVESAEAAEMEADRALDAARLSVRDARTEVKRIEEEAREDARRAKLKQHHAKDISKRGKGLGRHG